jgi:hypothetical protein
MKNRDNYQRSSAWVAWFIAGATAGVAATLLVNAKRGGFRQIRKVAREGFEDIREFFLAEDLDDFPDYATPEAALESEEEDEILAEGESGEVFEDEDDILEDEDEIIEDEIESLEARVLEEFHGDVILSRRAIDIGAIAPGVIELTGWVRSEDEAARASSVAGRAPGVETVVNRVTVRSEPLADVESTSPRDASSNTNADVRDVDVVVVVPPPTDSGGTSHDSRAT